MATETFEETLRRRSTPADDGSGCVRWLGAHVPTGYGQIKRKGVGYAVHRLAYELWVGPIPDGLEIDHVYSRGCRHRDCINPDHLEAVTHAENLRRKFAGRSHCKHGHSISQENTIVKRRGAILVRMCRACVNDYKRRKRRELRTVAT